MLDTGLEPEVADAGREVPAPSPAERPVRKIIHVDMRFKGKNMCNFGRFVHRERGLSHSTIRSSTHNSKQKLTSANDLWSINLLIASGRRTNRL